MTDQFYDFRFKSTATAAIGIHTTKAWLSQPMNFKNAIWHFRRTICKKFCFKLGKNARETYGMLQTAFGASFKNQASVFEWHKRFKEGRESVREDGRCGRSNEVNRPELIGQRVRVRVTMLSLRDNWGDERGCDEDHWHAHTRGLPWVLPEVVGTVEQVHCTRRRLLRRGLEFHVCTINKSAHTKKVWKLIGCTLYIYIYIYIYIYKYFYVKQFSLT